MRPDEGGATERCNFNPMKRFQKRINVKLRDRPKSGKEASKKRLTERGWKAYGDKINKKAIRGGKYFRINFLDKRGQRM